MRRHLSLLCAGLIERGMECTVAAPEEFELDPDVALPAGAVPVVRAAIAARPRPIADLRAAASVRRAASGARILHAHGLRAAWVSALAARRLALPFVFTAHNLAPAKPGALTRILFALIARRADAVIAISRSVAASLAPYGIAPAATTLIPNGIPLAPYRAPRDTQAVRRDIGVPADATLVVAIGRLSPEKGFDVLARAAAIVRADMPNAWFVLAGNGPEAARLRECAPEGFLLPGRYADIPGLLQAADVVAVPSRLEGQGLVALEAMAAARPVVASRVGGLAETVREGVTGLLVPADDPAALADAIRDLLRSGEERARLGAAGREVATRDYAVGAMVDRTVELYRRLLAGRADS